MKYSIVLFLLIFFCTHLNAQQLVTYPAPKQVIYAMHNDDYTVKVRRPGGEWQDLYEYKVKVDMDKVADASMVYFDFSGTVEVMVRKNNENIRSVKVRPVAYGITPTVKGNTILFTLNQPRKISVEFNGDKLHNLHVFANGIETSKPDSNDANVIYFGAGLHTPGNGQPKEYKIPSGKTVYIAGGAVVRGKFVCDSVQNVRICGRGIVDQPQEGIQVTFSNNVHIEGIIFIDPRHYTILGGSSKNITIQNIKSFSYQGWADGIDMMCCTDVKIDDVFMRNSDDCIALYAHRWKFYGNTRNCTVTNSTLWADIAHPINMGIHGNTDTEGDTLENCVFKNINILEQDEDDTEYQGCMAMNAGDYNLIRNIRFENIRIDDIEEGQLFNIRVVYNKQYNTGPGRGVQNIYFKNIRYTGNSAGSSIINGLDGTHMVQRITFDNVQINGKHVTNAASANIKTGAFVKQVTFK